MDDQTAPQTETPSAPPPQTAPAPASPPAEAVLDLLRMGDIPVEMVSCLGG